MVIDSIGEPVAEKRIKMCFILGGGWVISLEWSRKASLRT